MRQPELLIPAKNQESGILAINYGADAVYIGASRFGARADAGNSVADIQQLVRYAHQYRAKVYVTLNTILYDNELDEACRLIRQLYEIGVDALIIQDMGILEMDLPPIALHASTQANNFDPQRIAFLDQIGFKRIVLAREMSLEDIRSVAKNTQAELEVFIHGSLCVSLSGQCYLSYSIGGRSANRGECAQPCRKIYSLSDADGNLLLHDKHLLSLKDMNRSASLEDLINAGVTSFKVEGRLKDQSYVKNITSYYRKQIDSILDGKPELKRPSSGRNIIHFTPDPERTFSRGYTDYYLHGRTNDVTSMDTPKSTGKFLGKVNDIQRDHFTLSLSEEIHNNDGLIFFTPDGILSGIKVNRVDGNKIYPAIMPDITKGTGIWRNYDHLFLKSLDSDSSTRLIESTIDCLIGNDTIRLTLKDEDQLTTTCSFDGKWESARNPQKMIETLKQQLSKTGNSIFSVIQISVKGTPCFIPISQINEMRRTLVAQATDLRLQTFSPSPRLFSKSDLPFPYSKLDYTFNVSNHLARQFYLQHGVEQIDDALETGNIPEEKVVMTTRHCLKYAMNCCPKYHKSSTVLHEPLFLSDGERTFRLKFKCNICMMQIIKD